MRSQLSDRGYQAALRIAKNNNISVDKVIAAFKKAASRKTPLTPKSLFLPQ